ncbi:MAG: methylated-DNA--[protein]-cysteine S-methyltransferase [candidate division WOR-3 bacterium]
MNSIEGKVVYNLPVGKILLIANTKSLIRVVFLDYESVKLTFKISNNNKILEKAEKFLVNYFQKRIWYAFEYIDYENLNPILREILNIPFGNYLYYSNFEKFPRAIGKILSSNKLPIFIPCHRVISKKSIGGYTPSPKIKKILLNHENIIPFRKLL